MPVRPGTVPVVGLPAGMSIPELPSHRLSQAPQPFRVPQAEPALQSTPLAHAQPELPGEPLNRQGLPPPVRTAPWHAAQLPGFGFKYLQDNNPVETEGVNTTRAAAPLTPAPVGFQAAGRSGYAEGYDDPDLALMPVTCLGLMASSPLHQPEAMWTENSAKNERTSASQLGSPVSQSLLPSENQTVLPPDLKGDTISKMPESSGAAAFTSALMSLRQNDILSHDEVLDEARLVVDMRRHLAKLGPVTLSLSSRQDVRIVC